MRKLIFLSFVFFIFTSCNQPSSPNDNQAPLISPIANQQTLNTKKISVPFTVSDEQLENIRLTATSSDQNLIKNTNIQVLGTGQNRTLEIQPELATGRLNIELTATDTQGLNTKTSFSLSLATKLAFPDATNYAQFGKAVDISGRYAIVGASGTDVAGTSSGSAYIFEQKDKQWGKALKLIGNDTSAFNNFGAAVAISGDYAIVGAPLNNSAGTQAGAAYIFKRQGTNWLQQTKLEAPDPNTINRFGNAVALSGDYAIVGAWSKTEQSAAYIFKRTNDTWSKQATLMAQDTTEPNLFGRSVALSGDYAIVGATWDQQAARDAGAAYVFKRTGNNWQQQIKLIGSNEGDGFGNAVALSENYAIIAASQHKHNGPLSGTTYIYERVGNNWTEKDKLTAQDQQKGLFFGKSVDISGDTIIVGANGLNDAGLATGTTYIFKRDDQNWTQINKLVASDAKAQDSFGSAVALSETDMLIGASFHDQNNITTGTAYIFPR